MIDVKITLDNKGHITAENKFEGDTITLCEEMAFALYQFVREIGKNSFKPGATYSTLLDMLKERAIEHLMDHDIIKHPTD